MAFCTRGYLQSTKGSEGDIIIASHSSSSTKLCKPNFILKTMQCIEKVIEYQYESNKITKWILTPHCVALLKNSFLTPDEIEYLRLTCFYAIQI